MTTTRAAHRRAEEEQNIEDFDEVHSEDELEHSVSQNDTSTIGAQQAALTYRYRELATSLARSEHWDKKHQDYISPADWLIHVEHILSAQVFLQGQEALDRRTYTQLFLNAIPPRVGRLLRMNSGEFVCWEDAKEIFLQEVMGVDFAAKMYTHFSGMKQGADERILHFYQRFEQAYEITSKYCGAAFAGGLHLAIFTPKLNGRAYAAVRHYFTKKNYDFSVEPEKMYADLKRFLLSRTDQVDGRQQNSNSEEVNYMGQYSGRGYRNQPGRRQDSRGNRNGNSRNYRGQDQDRRHHDDRGNNSQRRTNNNARRRSDDEDRNSHRSRRNQQQLHNIEDQENEDGTSAMSQ